MYDLRVYRSPPRTRRSSTSSTGSSGNGGFSGGLNLTSGGLATAKRASRLRSRSPSPRPSVAAAAKLSAPVVDAGRRSRSPTPRANGTSAADRLSVRNAVRSRSVTPCRRQKQRSASPSVPSSVGCGRLLVPNSGQRTNSNNRSRSPSAARSSGVDDTPTPKISLNFTSELAAEISDRLSRESSVDDQRWTEPRRIVSVVNGGDDEDDVAVDTSSTCRVSENFRGTEQYHVLNATPVAAIERRHSTVREEDSDVDTTPFCRVSDSLRVAAYDCPSASTSRKKSYSSSHRDAKKSEPVGTDSGSEVSDEGYRSLGIVTSPPVNTNAKIGHKFNGKHAYHVKKTILHCRLLEYYACVHRFVKILIMLALETILHMCHQHSALQV